MTVGDCGDCHKDKEGRTVDVVDTNIDWSFVGTSQEPVDSQVDRDLGMSLAETIERRIQGVERKYWSYCQVSRFAQRQGSQLIAHAPLQFEEECHLMGHDHPGNKTHFVTQYPQQFGVPTSNSIG
jgi:hypothetical protein